MQRQAIHHETPAPSLLSLIERDGGDMGATLLRLAHRAAAQHRYRAAMSSQGPSPAAVDAQETPLDSVARGEGGQR